LLSVLISNTVSLQQVKLYVKFYFLTNTKSVKQNTSAYLTDQHAPTITTTRATMGSSVYAVLQRYSINALCAIATTGIPTGGG